MQKPILNTEPIWLTDELSLQRARIHEVMGQASDSFAVMMAFKLKGPIVWIGRGHDVGSITPTALKNFIDPARIVLTEGTSRKEVLWAGEQALRSKGAALTIIELHIGPDLRESRRLQLAAEEGKGVGLILIRRRAQSSASQTRWICEPQLGSDEVVHNTPMPGPWVWEMTKNKSGPVGRWSVKWREGKDATHNVHMVSATAA